MRIKGRTNQVFDFSLYHAYAFDHYYCNYFYYYYYFYYYFYYCNYYYYTITTTTYLTAPSGPSCKDQTWKDGFS
jgi:hypothetical protein